LIESIPVLQHWDALVGEISRNLGFMINELTEAIERDYDVIQLEMCRTNVLRYLEKLREKLGDTGFVSGKSSISAELERLLSEKFNS
jgi:hypothetical protein